MSKINNYAEMLICDTEGYSAALYKSMLIPENLHLIIQFMNSRKAKERMSITNIYNLYAPRRLISNRYVLEYFIQS